MSLAYAELLKNRAEYILDVDPAGDPAERRYRQPQLLGRHLPFGKWQVAQSFGAGLQVPAMPRTGQRRAFATAASVSYPRGDCVQ